MAMSSSGFCDSCQLLRIWFFTMPMSLLLSVPRNTNTALPLPSCTAVDFAEL
jgi:hypothetical protein